jgi:acyl carrier protein phosphodiesterase
VNFLAHFHLAWPDEGLVAGGLEGDYLKGVLRGQLPHNVERGVKLHRAIDAYTDGHPLIIQLRRELPPDLRRYAGILIDLCFDHYLSLHWSRFSNIPIDKFNAEVYQILAVHEQVFSHGARTMASRLIEYDILNLYGEWETVPATAARIGQRFKRHNPFLELDRELTPAKTAVEQTFLNFYPQLESFCRDSIARL